MITGRPLRKFYIYLGDGGGIIIVRLASCLLEPANRHGPRPEGHEDQTFSQFCLNEHSLNVKNTKIGSIFSAGQSSLHYFWMHSLLRLWITESYLGNILSHASGVGSPTNHPGYGQRQDPGPGILWSADYLKIQKKKNGPNTGPVLLGQGEPGMSQYIDRYSEPGTSQYIDRYR